MSTVDDDSDASDEESVIILTQMQDKFTDDTNSTMSRISHDNNAMLLAQQEGWQAINSDLVLINSQSTVDLFTNPNHVQNIRLAKQPIPANCTLVTTEEADFGDTPVYFDTRGIANVLSLYRLGKKICVTYDSSNHDGVFQVHTTKGIVKFKPTPKGLHALNLNSLTPKSVPAGTKLVLFGSYVLNIYVGIVRYFLRTTKLSPPKSTYRHNAQIGEYCTILTSARKIRFWPSTHVID